MHNYKMMRDHISMSNITEGEFVATIVDAVLAERLSKLRKIDYILGVRWVPIENPILAMEFLV